MKALRYIIFIPIITLIVLAIYYLIPLTLLSLMSLDKIELIFFILCFGGIVVAFFQFLPGGVAWISSKISPNRSFAFYSTFIISFYFAFIRIFSYWNYPEVHESGLGKFYVIILTCLTIGFATSFSIGAGINAFKNGSALLSFLLSFGSLIFYLGIFLLFCLFTTTICYINPDKTYTWYSGIWHGIFGIPHWIVSWFSNDIYCKAPNSTIAYSIWWWFCCVFFSLGIFGGGRQL